MSYETDRGQKKPSKPSEPMPTVSRSGRTLVTDSLDRQVVSDDSDLSMMQAARMA